MTIQEFNCYNRTNTMPSEWIGQGYGYKDTSKEWNNINDDDIIYIPECAYVGGTVDRDDAYSKQDFKRIIRSLNNKYNDVARHNTVDRMAMELFEAVDWQFPESLLNEDFFEE